MLSILILLLLLLRYCSCYGTKINFSFQRAKLPTATTMTNSTKLGKKRKMTPPIWPQEQEKEGIGMKNFQQKEGERGEGEGEREGEGEICWIRRRRF